MKGEERVLLGHGAGGILTKRLVEQVFQKNLNHPELKKLDDSALLNLTGKSRLVFTTDSYVVSPLFFPGGDIGKLAINGTVNDLAVMGARPVYISAGFILEEGLSIRVLEDVVCSMSKAANQAGVYVVAADTKVVHHGKADGVFITTSGIGILEGKKPARKIKDGDKVIVSGTVGDHGAAVLLSRKKDELRFDTTIKSDCAPLNGMHLPIFKEFGRGIHWVRDITRGGLLTVLNEAVSGKKYEIHVTERDIPVHPEVKSVCEVLGLDPFYLANEGKAVLIVEDEVADSVLHRLKRHPYGKNARLIGSVVRGDGRVYLETVSGGLRIADSLLDDPVPRIC